MPITDGAVNVQEFLDMSEQCRPPQQGSCDAVPPPAPRSITLDAFLAPRSGIHQLKKDINDLQPSGTHPRAQEDTMTEGNQEFTISAGMLTDAQNSFAAGTEKFPES
ncbi:unnamed protein product, partial [Prorocentrum cordatum]